MADFHLYRLLRGQKSLVSLGIVCKDWKAVRESFDMRGRSENEQLVVLHDGLIYAIERQDGKGFAMTHQDRQGLEDDYWYPDWKARKQTLRRERGIEEE